MAASQSSTELKVLKSGMDLSNSGWEGLEEGEERRGEGRGGWEDIKSKAGIWCNIKQGGFEGMERNCGHDVCETMQDGEGVCAVWI